MDYLFLVNILLGLVAVLYLLVIRKYQYWKKWNVPYIEPFFFFGNTKGVNKEFHISEAIQKIYTKLKPNGPLGGLFIFIRPVAIALDLDLVKDILVKDFSNFPNRGLYSNEKDDPLSAHLVNIEDDEWRSLRHKISPTFTSGKLKFMFVTISDVADKLIETIAKETKESGQLEVKDVLARFTTDVIGSTAFGIECNSLEDKTTKFYEMGLEAFKSSSFIKRSFRQAYPNLARKLGMRLTGRELEEFYMNVVSKTIKYREENPDVKRNDFMNLMIELKDPSRSDALTFNQIAAQSVVFFLAGEFYSKSSLIHCRWFGF